MNFKTIIPLVLFLAFMSSCVTTTSQSGYDGLRGYALVNKVEEETKKSMQSWVGFHKSDLIQAWGPPTSVSSDGKDGQTFTYLQTGAFSFGNLDMVKNFFIDSKGVVYNYRYAHSLR